MFLLNPTSGVPLYLQLQQQLQQRILSGTLPHGSQLPSVRDLSAELHLNPLTVAKAYQFLERDGLVEFRRGHGTFVVPGRKLPSLTQQRKLIQPAIDQVVSEALHLGLTEPQLQHLIHQAYAAKHP